MRKRCLAAPATTAAVTLLLFFLFQLYPFSDQTLAWCDMKQQVIPFLLDFKNIISGNSDMLLNLQNAGGMSFWGVFFFFIASPFTFLVLLVPAAQMYLFANILVLLKMCACSLTAALFFQRRFRNLSTVQVTALSVMYAFCGYTMLYFQNMVWLDVMAMFPILLIGVDLLVREGRILCFVLAFSAVLVLNFYLTYMVVVFLILAFGLFLFFCEKDREKRKRTVFLLGVSAFLTMLITAAVWLPSFLQYLSSARTIGILENLASGSFMTHYYTTLPILLCSGGVFAAIAILKGQSFGRETKALLVLWLLTVVPIFIEPVNKMWHTGSYQAFPARYGYIPVFLGLIFLAKAISDLNGSGDLPFRQEIPGAVIGLFLVGSMALVAYMLITYRFEDLTIYTRALWLDQTSILTFLIFTAVAVLSYFLLMYLYRNQMLTKGMFSFFLILAVVCESLFSGSVFIGSAANPDLFYQPVFDLSGRISDDSLYRVKNSHKYFDLNLMGGLGYPTLNHYTSLTDEDYMFTMKKLGYSSYWMEVGSQDGSLLTDALLGNRYTVVQSREVKPEDDVVYQNDWYAILKNKYRMSFGTVMSSQDISKSEDLPDATRMEIQQSIFEQLFHSSKKLVTEYEYSSSENLKCTKTKNGTVMIKEDPETNGTLSYDILVEGTQTLYLDCFDKLTNNLSEPINNSFHVSVNDRTVQSMYPAQKENGLLNLGTFTDELVRVRLTVYKDVSAKSFGIYGMDLSTLGTSLDSAPSVSLKQQGNAVSGTVTVSGNDRYLFLPLPLQKGYTATVNGKDAQIFRVFDDFMAIKLSDGENQVSVRYLPPGFRAGIVISGFGVVLLPFLLYALRKRKFPRLRGILEDFVFLLFKLLAALVFVGIYIFPVIVYWAG